MDARFTVLASGSAGNAALLEVNGFGLLIDCGLHARTLSARLASIGATWNSIHAAILTHTHGDHWKDTALARLRSLRLPLFAHERHLDQLNGTAPSFESLHAAKLTRTYADRKSFALAPGLTCEPIAVPHDADPTFAFRIEHGGTAGWSLGYASDLGVVPANLAPTFAGVDVLAVEFNHDEEMQKASARPPHLIRRVLGDQGHLSNHQAAAFTKDVLTRSGGDGPSWLVQLHLSRECNTPAMAAKAGRDAVAPFGRPVAVVTTRQDIPSRSIALEPRSKASISSTFPTTFEAAPFAAPFQPRLPGFDL